MQTNPSPAPLASVTSDPSTPSQYSLLRCTTGNVAPAKEDELCDNFSIPFSAILTPQPPPGYHIPTHSYPPPTCPTCSAIFPSPLKPTATCDICFGKFQLNQNIQIPPQESPPVDASGISIDAIDYIVSGASDSSYKDAPMQLIAIDLCADSNNEQQISLHHIKAALLHSIDTLDDSYRIGLIPFGAVACAVRLQSNDTASTAVYADVVLPPQAITNADTSLSDACVYVSSVGESRKVLHNAIQSLRAQKMPANINTATQLHRCKIAIEAAISISQHKPIPQHRHHDEEMQRPSTNVNAHLTIVTSSCSLARNTLQNTSSNNNNNNDYNNNKEEEIEEEEAIDTLSDLALGHGIVVDILNIHVSDVYTTYSSTTSTSSSIGLTDRSMARAFHLLTQSTGGIYLEQHTSLQTMMHDDTLQQQLQATNLYSLLTRDIVNACTVQVLCSQGIGISEISGPLAMLSLNGKPQHPEWQSLFSSFDVPFRKRLQQRNASAFLCNPPNSNQGMILVLQCTTRAATVPSISLQVLMSWTKNNGTKVQRVVTKRFKPLTYYEAARSIDGTAAAVFMGKALATEALNDNIIDSRVHAEILKKAMVTALHRMAYDHGDPDASSSGWFRGPSRYALPRGTLPLAEALYLFYFRYLSSTRLFSSGGINAGTNNNDNTTNNTSIMANERQKDRQKNKKLSYFQRLVAAPYDVAERMVCPMLYALFPPARVQNEENVDLDFSTRLALEFIQVPAVDVALFLSMAAVVDAGTAVYVWMGGVRLQNVPSLARQRILNACMQHASSLASTRLPHADVILVDDTCRSPAYLELFETVLGLLVPIASDDADIRLRLLPILPGFSTQDVDTAVETAKEVALSLSSEGMGDAPGLPPTLYQWLRKSDILLPPVFRV